MKRVFSLLLVLLLVVGLVPVQANAATNSVMACWYDPNSDANDTTYTTGEVGTWVPIVAPAGKMITFVYPPEGDTSGDLQVNQDGGVWYVKIPSTPNPEIGGEVADAYNNEDGSRKYNVSVSPYIENGTFVVDLNEAITGETIHITPKPAADYKLSYVIVYNADADGIEYGATPNGDGTYSFTVQDFNITIGGGFEPDSTPQPPAAQRHSITVTPDGNGTASATVNGSPANTAMKGEIVTVTGTPEDGYRLAGITVTNDTTTEAVPLQADGKTFYMPDSNVTVTASFEVIPSHKVTVTKPDCVTLDISDGEEIREGAPVTIIPRIDGDFMPETLTITGPDGEKIELNDNHQFIMPSGPVTIEITVVPSVTITFAPNGGTVDPAAVTIQKGTALGTLPQPVRQDYLFTGWYPAAGDKITTSTVFDANTTVTARWVKAEHTTKLRGNDFGADIAMENIDVLDLLLDEDDLSQGKDIIVYMEVDKLGELAVPKEDKSAIDAKAGSDKLAAYLDITLWKKIGDDPETRITNTNGDVPITMTLDEGIVPADAGSVYIIYYHEGKVATITNGVSYNASSRVLRFPANEFSTYALAYKVQAPAATTSAGVLDNVPKTGDSAPLMSWTMLVLCSAAMLAGVALFDKKRAR